MSDQAANYGDVKQYRLDRERELSKDDGSAVTRSIVPDLSDEIEC